MSVFDKGSNQVTRRAVVRNITGTTATLPLPAGAKVTRVDARNKGTVAVNLSVGNAAAGAQFLAATAVPVATSNTDITTAGLLSEQALSVAVSKTAGTVYLTLSATPGAPGVDVVVHYTELLDSLAPKQTANPPAY